MNEPKRGSLDIDVTLEQAEEPTYIPPGGRVPGETPVAVPFDPWPWVIGLAVIVMAILLLSK